MDGDWSVRRELAESDGCFTLMADHSVTEAELRHHRLLAYGDRGIAKCVGEDPQPVGTRIKQNAKRRAPIH